MTLWPRTLGASVFLRRIPNDFRRLRASGTLRPRAQRSCTLNALCQMASEKFGHGKWRPGLTIGSRQMVFEKFYPLKWRLRHCV